jgi:Asp-tRNA(Asn)/Glu-tRNA(Gln) amidotransferase B subunit
MRVKNTDQEYCYLYEPNLRKFKLTKSFQELQLKGIPETPEEIQTSLIKVHDINDITLKKLINKPVLLLLLYRYCQQIDQ